MRSLLFAAPALLVASACTDDTILQTRPDPRTISVTGEATITAVPDVAMLDFSVRTRAVSSNDTFSEATVKMNGVIDALKEQGLEDRDLQTDQIGMNPVYAQTDRGRQDRTRIVAYEAYQSLSVRLRDIDNAGVVIDAAVRAGANGLNSFRMTIDDTKAMQDEARVAAVKDAVAKAKAMAEAAGAELGPVMTLSAHNSGRQPQMMRASAMSMEADMAGPSLQAGEQTLTMSVSATFKLQ